MKKYNYILIFAILVIIAIITFFKYIGGIIQIISPFVKKNIPSLLMWGFIFFLIMYYFSQYINAREKRYKNKLTLNLKNQNNIKSRKIDFDKSRIHFLNQNKKNFMWFTTVKKNGKGEFLGLTLYFCEKKPKDDAQMRSFDFIEYAIKTGLIISPAFLIKYAKELKKAPDDES